MQKLISTTTESARSRHADKQPTSRTRAINKPRTAPHPTEARTNDPAATATAVSHCRVSVKAGHLQ